MFDAKQCSSNHNQLKIGYMSTTNISTIMSRYQTACGDDIIVYQFLDSNPKQMEFEFKKHFQAQHVKLEFYDAARHYEYLHWCLNYTNTAPVIGYKKLNIVSEVFTKNVGTQYDSVVIPTPSPAPQFNISTWREIDDKVVQCIQCEKIVTRRCIQGHLKVCNGVPKNTCEYCLRKFNNRQCKFSHQKICKQNPVNIPLRSMIIQR